MPLMLAGQLIPAHGPRRRRGGSVLILVVALLVLLALMGTAYLSTATTERYAIRQHTVNTQADLLLQGVVSAVQGSIVGDVSSAGAYRTPSQEMPYPAGGLVSNYCNFDGLGSFTVGPTATPVAHDLFLADRIPTLGQPLTDIDGLPNTSVSWATVSWPLFSDAAGNYMFDSPFENGTTELPVNTWGLANRSAIRFYPAPKYENGKLYPGLLLYVPPGKTVVDASGDSVNPVPGFLTPTASGFESQSVVNQPGEYANLVVFAADADGDGIADSPLWKLPISPIDGITYFAAVRVVDNNAAFNASTAFEMASDPGASLTATGTTNYGFFRSNVGLLEALNPSPTGANAPTPAQEMAALNAYRFLGTVSPPASAASPTLSLTPYDDNLVARTDFVFASAGDLLDSQLARRGLNPGYASSNGGTHRLAWLGINESAALAYRFCLTNPIASPSLLPTLLPNETGASTPLTTPYAADHIYTASTSSAGFWFNDQFAVANNLASSPCTAYSPQLRSLLVGTNAQSNAIPSRFGNTAGPPLYSATATYQFGDLVIGSDGCVYVSLCSNNNTTALNSAHALPISTLATNNPTDPATPGPTTKPSIGQAAPMIYENPFWGRVPWSTVPVKASANTATFEQLWMAFCNVMTDSVNPATPTTPVQWNPPQSTPGKPNALDTYDANDHERQLAMFRSSVRDNSTTPGNGFVLTPMQEMQLRAGLAAVNTMDLRDGDDDVTSRHIVLDDSTGNPQFDVELYGTEKQPYILEVLADVQDGGGSATANFLAVELVNPYPTPIVMTPSWHFAYLSRPGSSNGSAPQVGFHDIGPLASTVIVPPAQNGSPGVAYITSQTISGGNNPQSKITAPINFPTDVITTVLQSPTTSNNITANNFGTVAGLESALGGELVILKPRLAATPDRLNDTTNFPSSDRSISTDPYDHYNEVNNPQDLVPVDQVDFTGSLALTNASYPHRLHYRRAANPQASTSYAWNFVYPGPYFPSLGNTGPTSAPTTSPTSSTQPTVFAVADTLRQAFAVQQETANVANNDVGDFADVTNATLLPLGSPSADVTTTPTYFTAPIQLCNVNMAGPNPTFTAPLCSSSITATGKTVQCTAASPTKINQFPFGGFARNGDLLEIPFIGAYRITAFANAGSASASTTLVEMNSVSMDSAYAWDSTLAASSAGQGTGNSPVTIDGVTQAVQYNPITQKQELAPQGATVNQPQVSPPGDSQAITGLGSNFLEQIGRFCPVGNCGAGSASDDFLEPTSTVDVTGNWHYHWARRVFDYLTVDAPHDDYFPNVDPRPQLSKTALGTVTPSIAPPYPPTNLVLNSPPAAAPEPVANRKPTIANLQLSGAGQLLGSEDTVGVEGLININTAPLQVLASLPFVPRGTDNITYLPAADQGSIGTVAGSLANPDDLNSTPTLTHPPTPRDDNTDLAQAIIDYRNANGPFKSIFDLYKVPAFALENQILWQNATEPNAAQGYFIANRPAAGSDSPRYDFAERFLLLDHVSNLITTRSDSFTCYVLLQGWRGVGTGSPTLAVQRRAAFLLDRTNVTPRNTIPAMFPVSTN